MRFWILLLLFGVHGSVAAQNDAEAPLPNGAEPGGHHESLNGLLYVQTAVEFRAVSIGVYHLAKIKLDEALQDKSWTAALEQMGDRDFSSLPPAVILDVDETVLDNSAFQARLIEDGTSFNSENWLEWVDEEKATPVPGALEFIQYAASRGVQIIYLTNRDASGERATRKNLISFGFPVASEFDAVLTRGERPEWARSDKTPRRQFVADSYRILLLIGDNYGDFAPDSNGSLSDRDVSAANYSSLWGNKWIVLPNPLYGSWERALIDYEYGADVKEKLQRKYSRLQTAR